MDVDVVVVGAGPSGLCFAKMLAQTGLSIALLERQSEQALASPAFDGREIALTLQSATWMQDLGLWQYIDSAAISPLRQARVLNGQSLAGLLIDARQTQQAQLGYLVSNQWIKKSAYLAVKSSPNITLISNTEIMNISKKSDGVTLTLSNTQKIRTQLLVAADNRFSETRRRMGISASMHEFGKSMLVCVMKHEVDHAQTAWEWFDYGQTLALLPMNGGRSSVVLTLPPQAIKQLLEMPEPAFNADMQQRFGHRLGAMELVSTRHAYPLVTVYANQFVQERFALIGDAAVGMHPVTAHGFNFALSGANVLASEIRNAQSQGQSIASSALLNRYQIQHRRNTRPLFMATHAIAKLYSDDRMPARILRHASLTFGQHVAPFKRALASMLTAVN